MAKPYSKAYIEISNICNLQCSFCPEVIRPKRLMPVDLFAKIIAQMAPLTDQVHFHLMGDPLVHPRLSHFIDLCAAEGVKVNLVSNGVLLTETKAKLLLHPVVRQVNFSLHSFFDNFSGQDPTAYLEKIFAFTEAAFLERPDLYINYRLWNLGRTDAAGEQNQEMLQRIAQRFQVEINTAIDVRRLKSQRLLGRLYLHFDTEFTWPALDLPVLGEKGRCYGLSSHFGVLVDGTVVPCCLDKEAGIPLGNIADAPLTTILAGPRAKNLLAGFARGRLVEDLCQRCQYITRFR